MSQLKHCMLGPTPPHYFNCPMAVKVDEITVDKSSAASKGAIAHQMAELALIYAATCSRRFYGKVPTSAKRFGRKVK